MEKRLKYGSGGASLQLISRYYPKGKGAYLVDNAVIPAEEKIPWRLPVLKRDHTGQIKKGEKESYFKSELIYV